MTGSFCGSCGCSTGLHAEYPGWDDSLVVAGRRTVRIHSPPEGAHSASEIVRLFSSSIRSAAHRLHRSHHASSVLLQNRPWHGERNQPCESTYQSPRMEDRPVSWRDMAHGDPDSAARTLAQGAMASLRRVRSRATPDRRSRPHPRRPHTAAQPGDILQTRQAHDPGSLPLHAAHLCALACVHGIPDRGRVRRHARCAVAPRGGAHPPGAHRHPRARVRSRVLPRGRRRGARAPCAPRSNARRPLTVTLTVEGRRSASTWRSDPWNKDSADVLVGCMAFLRSVRCRLRVVTRCRDVFETQYDSDPGGGMALPVNQAQ
ncbi:hypothetical protein BKA93DRAFT_613783 [Sparassis latifolia]